MTWSRVLNKEKVAARLARIPAAVKLVVRAQLQANVDGLVAAMQRAAPVDVEGLQPGALRDSVHSYPNRDRDLSLRIIADARDEKGRFIGAHVEFGHLTPDGTRHVPGRPFFFPTYRAQKRPMRRKISDAARKAFRAAAKE